MSVWVRSATDAWVEATLLSSDEDYVTVNDPSDASKQVVYPKGDVHKVDKTHGLLFDDVCSINDLHEAPLLHLLRCRYREDQIYTAVGKNLLISVNPYKQITGLYENPLKFFNISETNEYDLLENDDDDIKPHVYKISNNALNALITSNKSQSLIVSGESGAGKTEASKKLMHYLVAANLQLVNGDDSNDDGLILDAKRAENIQKSVEGSNLVFESFGNAKTVRNDNSSRFGKYIKLLYSSLNHLVSAHTETFLLEKSRLLSCSKNESNYHVFYSLVDGLSKVDPDLYVNMDICQESITGSDKDNADGLYQKFKILCDSDSQCTWYTENSVKEFDLNEILNCLTNIHINEEEKKNLLSLLCCLLHMGNITCNDSDDGGPTRMNCSSTSISKLSQVFGLDEATFISKMMIQIVQIRGRSSIATKNLNANETRNNIYAFMKLVYSSIFNYVVAKTNYAHYMIGINNDNSNEVSKFIGILDIFGFEIMNLNSFEQLCINFANEKLQQFFNKHVFISEQEEYSAQGIVGSSVTFCDNQDVIDVIVKKPDGLFCIMDDLAKVNQVDDTRLIGRFHQAHDLQHNNKHDSGNCEETTDRHHGCYIKPRTNSHNEFGIHHFAGEVMYTIGTDSMSFLRKNNDALQQDLKEVFMITNNDFVANIVSKELDLSQRLNQSGYIPPMNASSSNIDENGLIANDIKQGQEKDDEDHKVLPEKTKKMASARTVSNLFTEQVENLMSTLQETSPNYLKCMKPNTYKRQELFDGNLMLQQLRYSGVLEVVRIRREGYPWKASYTDFYKQFEIIVLKRQLHQSWPKDLSNLTNEVMKEYVQQLFDEELDGILNNNQNVMELSLYEFGYTKIYLREEGFMKLENYMNSIMHKECTKIQSYVRRFLYMRRYNTIYRLIILLQSIVRGKKGRLWCRREQERVFAEAVEKARLKAIEEAVEEEKMHLLELQRQKEEEIRLQEEEKHRKEEEAKQSIISFHDCCQFEEVQDVQTLLSFDNTLISKTLYDATNKMKDHKISPLLSAAKGVNFEVLKFLNAGPSEILHRGGANHCNALLFAAMGIQQQDNTAVNMTEQQLSMYRENNLNLNNVLKYFLRAANDEFPLERVYNTFCVLDTREQKRQQSRPLNGKDDDLCENEPNNDKSNTYKATGIVLKEGWLKKKHERGFYTSALNSKAWVRRWVKVTDEAVMYFRSPNDITPRDTISFTRNLGKMNLHYFKGYSGLPCVSLQFAAASGLKKRTQISFSALDEQEMEEWSIPLKQLSNMINGSFKVEPIIRSMNALNTKTCKSIIQSRSAEGNTCLHMLCRRLFTIDMIDELIYSISWLVGMGLDVNIRNNLDLSGNRVKDGYGCNALHYALQSKNTYLALGLVMLGAEKVTTVHNDDLCHLFEDPIFKSQYNVLRQCYQNFKIKNTNNEERSGQLPNYTYLSLHIQNQHFTKSDSSLDKYLSITQRDLSNYNPCLRIYILSRNYDHVVPVQIIGCPIVQHAPIKSLCNIKNEITSESTSDAINDIPMNVMKFSQDITSLLSNLTLDQRDLHWGRTANFQNPVDYIPDGSIVIFQYCSHFEENAETLGWAYHILEFATLRTTTGNVTVPLLSANVADSAESLGKVIHQAGDSPNIIGSLSFDLVLFRNK
jgi:myosin-5